MIDLSMLLDQLIIKIIVMLLVSTGAFAIKPIRKRLIRLFKRVTGKIKYSVTVKGYIRLTNYNHNRSIRDYFSEQSEELFYYEIELPYKNIDEDSMPIEESDYLIYNAIKYKYGRDLSNKGGTLNITNISSNEKY